jgi:hypothetical protein
LRYRGDAKFLKDAQLVSSEVKGGVVVPLLVGDAGLAGEAEIPQEAVLYKGLIP